MEEIKEFRASAKPVMLYFSTADMPQRGHDSAQYDRVLAFKQDIRDQGIVKEFVNVVELQRQLGRHLTATIKRLESERVIAGSLPDPDAGKGPPNPRAAPVDDAASGSFVGELLAIQRHLVAAWTSERDSQPYDIKTGKEILLEARRALLALVSRTTLSDQPETKTAIDEILRGRVRSGPGW